MTTKVLSVGGSIIAPKDVDVNFLKTFMSMIKDYVLQNSSARVILVAGGGHIARLYQDAYKNCTDAFDSSSADWLGVMATRLNAQLLKEVAGDLCLEPVVTDPTCDIAFTGKILVAAGWMPGFSSDNDAVLLAQKFNADTVVNLSNIKKVYTDDPKTNPQAAPLDKISWDDFCKIVGDTWTPGKNTPFDPIASKKAKKLGLKVICADGKDIQNTYNILSGKDFIGTVIQ